MATTFTTTINIRCWKEHTCISCGGKYSYELIRAIKGRAGTQEKSARSADVAVKKALETDVDLQPCPTCGTVQPDMIGRMRRRRHFPLIWIELIAFFFMVLLFAVNAIQANIMVWLAAGVCAALTLLHWALDLGDPNRDRMANRQLAAQRVAAGTVRYQPGKPTAPGFDDPARPPRSLFHKVALLVLPATVVFAASPEILRMSQGWPLNDDAYPPVVGPGDTTRIYMTEKLDTVKSYWRGDAHVSLSDSAGKGLSENLAAKTNQNDWPNNITVKSSEKHSSISPWVDVTLPGGGDLADKTVTCDIELHVAYPEMSGSSAFVVKERNLHRNVTLHLASANAGSSYSGMWWKGTFAALCAVLVCVFILIRSASALQKRALPTRIVPPEAPAAPAMPELPQV